MGALESELEELRLGLLDAEESRDLSRQLLTEAQQKLQDARQQVAALQQQLVAQQCKTAMHSSSALSGSTPHTHLALNESSLTSHSAVLSQNNNSHNDSPATCDKSPVGISVASINTAPLSNIEQHKGPDDNLQQVCNSLIYIISVYVFAFFRV